MKPADLDVRSLADGDSKETDAWSAAGKYLADHPDDISRLLREFRQGWCEERWEPVQFVDGAGMAKGVHLAVPADVEHGRAGVLDAYVRGDLTPHLHLDALGFSSRRSICVQFRNAWQDGDPPSAPHELDQQIQVPVFVPVAQVSQDDERVHLHRHIGVCVGLQRTEDCLRASGHAVYCSMKSGRLLRARIRIFGDDWKGSAIGRSIASYFHQSVRDVVKGGLEVVQDFSREYAETLWYRSLLGRLPSLFECLGVYVVDETVDTARRRVQEPGYFTVEVEDLLVGPFELLPGTVERHRNDHSTTALDRLEQAEQAADKARQKVLKRPVKELGGAA